MCAHLPLAEHHHRRGGRRFGGLIGGFAMQNVIDNIPFITTPAHGDHLPDRYDPKYYIIAVTFALLTTWVAGWFPARKASQVDPVEIIRGK
jgi:lipoprotein-releasing system permease protein